MDPETCSMQALRLQIHECHHHFFPPPLEVPVRSWLLNIHFLAAAEAAGKDLASTLGSCIISSHRNF
jgi:hypothetical protein